MSIQVRIGEEATENEAELYDWTSSTVSSGSTGLGLSVVSPKEVLTKFRSSTRTTAGTTTVVTAPSGGSLILTDLILGTDKRNAATVTVRFSDGTNTVNLFSTDVTDAPANLGLSFGGRVRGWADADLQFVTTGTVSATVTLVYYKSTNGLMFPVWDSIR